MSQKLDYKHIDKDPIIDLVRSEAQRQNTNLSPEFLDRLAHESGVSVGTIKNWFFGDTRRPQFLTIRFVLEGLGARLQVVRDDGTVARGPRS